MIGRQAAPAPAGLSRAARDHRPVHAGGDPDVASPVWPALLAPVIIIGGILTGVFTATEAGVVACLYAFVVSYFIYRQHQLADLRGILSTPRSRPRWCRHHRVAGALGWLLAYLEFNDPRFTFIPPSRPQDGVLLILTFDDAGAHDVRRIALGPARFRAGRGPDRPGVRVDPFQLGLIMVMANQIGATTPPMAPLLFVTTSIAGTSLRPDRAPRLPFIAAEVLVLLSSSSSSRWPQRSRTGC